MDAPGQPVVATARPRYSADEKLEILSFVRANSVREACKKYGVARSSIYLWSRHPPRNSPRAPRDPLNAEIASEESDDSTSTADSTVPTPHEVYEQPTGDDRGPTPARAGRNEDDSQQPAIDYPVQTTTNEHTARAASPPAQQNAPTAPAFVPESVTRPALVGYEGVQNGFPFIAARRTFAEVASTGVQPALPFEFTGYPHTSHLIDALRRREISFAFITADLLLYSTHNAVLGQVVASRLKMVGEVIVEEDASVCALPGTELCDADCIVSDWRTLQRYEEYIVYLEMQYKRAICRQVVWDSALGCQLVHEEKAAKTLVLCTTTAASTHGLVVLRGRLAGSPSYTRYAILGHGDETPLLFAHPEVAPTPSWSTTRRTLIVNGTARAILDIISAFAFRGLEILSFQTRDGEEQHLRSYLICYKASTNPLVEIGLHNQLGAASERVVALGEFTTRTLKRSS